MESTVREAYWVTHGDERQNCSEASSRTDEESTRQGRRSGFLGARASRPQWAEGPKWFKRAGRPRSQETRSQGTPRARLGSNGKLRLEQGVW